MTDLAAITARAETWIAALVADGSYAHAELIRDLLTYATTVSQERDEALRMRDEFHHIADHWLAKSRSIDEQIDRLATAEQERDAAIASAQVANGRLREMEAHYSRLNGQAW